MKPHREYSVSHGSSGFQLWVTDTPRRYWLLEVWYERFMRVIGDPCCFRGLGRIPHVGSVAYRALNAVLSYVHRHSNRVLTLPLTTEQALIIQPLWAEDLAPDGWITVDGPDEDGNVHADSRLVGVKCPDCGELVDAAGRYLVQVLRDHACADERDVA